MNMMPFEDFDVLEQRVREMVGQHALPPEVSRVGVRFGDQQDGDPAVWVDLYLQNEPGPERVDGQVWGRLMATLSQGARRIVPGRTASVLVLLDPSLR